MDIPRISAKETRRKMTGGANLLLVSAYDTEERFREMELDGALSWPALQSRLPSLPKDQEIVFYCACPAEASAAQRAAELAGLGYRHAKALAGGVDAWKKAGYPLVDRGPVSSLFGRILVPLDGSEAGEAVLYQAERLLCGRKGEVLLFTAWDPDATGFDTPEAAERYLKRVQERLLSAGARSVRRIIRSGPIARTLPEAVASEKASLVALSSHGRETAAHAPVAHVVEAILKESPVPLLVARAYRPGPSGEPIPSECEAPSISRILVPLDGSSACEAVMPYARELGRLLGARIIVLHVSDELKAEPGNFRGRNLSGEPLGPMPGENATPDQRIEFAARTFSSAGLETLALNVGGEPITSILEFARPSAVDLIAMTTHGRTGLAKLLMGSVAQKVLREAVLPTLVVRSDAPGAAGCLTP